MGLTRRTLVSTLPLSALQLCLIQRCVSLHVIPRELLALGWHSLFLKPTYSPQHCYFFVIVLYLIPDHLGLYVHPSTWKELVICFLQRKKKMGFVKIS